MKQYFIDTNACLRFFLNDIPKQKQVVEELFKKAKKGEVILHVQQIVIFELHFILDKYYHIEKKEIIDTLKTLVATAYIEVESKEAFTSALTMYKTAAISFVDCFILVSAKKSNAKIFTFDKKLEKLQ